MRLHRAVPKFVVAAVAALTLALAAAATDESQSVAVTIVNNTTTPAAGKDKPSGLLNINCGDGVHRVKKDTRQTIACTVSDDEAFELDYNDGTRTRTATIDCGIAGTPDFTDDSAVTLTFAGAGAAITFTQSCTGVGGGLT